MGAAGGNAPPQRLRPVRGELAQPEWGRRALQGHGGGGRGWGGGASEEERPVEEPLAER